MSVAALIRPAPADPSADGALVSKAVTRAAALLGLQQGELAEILGISPASASRLVAGTYSLAAAGKPFELALLLVRLFRSLSGAFGPDQDSIQRWMRGENLALGGTPAHLIRSATGLVNTLAYADAARARV
jgi:plasmid maintenance system antidote protein VapI